MLVPELHPEPPLHDHEHFILVLVPVPDELALEPGERDSLIVQPLDGPGVPVVVEQGELLPDVDLVHGSVSLRVSPSSSR